MSNDITIEQMNLKHFYDSMALSQFAFQYQKSAEELEQSKEQFQAEPAARWAAYVDGQFAAQATVLELYTYIGGKHFAMGGVAGVATWPQYRRQGLVAKLLVHSLKEMKEKGQTISFLHPFAFQFYRKFGWETYTENKLYTIKSDLLPPRTAYTGRFERITDDYKLLNELYEAYAHQYNGALVRTELWWKYRISKRKPGQTFVYYDISGSPQGYIIYEVKNYQLSVHELTYLSVEARTAIWSFIAQHDSMIEAATITVPSDDLLPYMLPNPRIGQEVIPYFMARIVDVEAFVEQYSFNGASEEDQLPIFITDEHAPWNAGYYNLHIQPSGSAVLQRLNENVRVEQAIKLDIGSFTALLIGYRSPQQLQRLGIIQGNEITINRLQVRIPERTTYLPDFF